MGRRKSVNDWLGEFDDNSFIGDYPNKEISGELPEPVLRRIEAAIQFGKDEEGIEVTEMDILAGLAVAFGGHPRDLLKIAVDYKGTLVRNMATQADPLPDLPIVHKASYKETIFEPIT